MSKKNKRKNKHFDNIKHVFLILVSLFFVSSGLFILWVSTITIPDFKSLNNRRVVESTKIYDRTGEILLYDSHRNIKRTIVKFDEISRFVKNTTIAIEDDEFYKHIGVKPLAFLRAVLVNIKGGRFQQGGSTITQQVVKNTLLTPEKKITRKLKEWILAIKLERAFSKEDILTLYLNETPYGGTIYGIEEASLSFFGKNAKDLTLAESAYLSALPQAPTRYSPYGNNVDKLEDRKNLVLSKMFTLNFISKSEYDDALKEDVKFLPQDKYGIKAPHFVIWVIDYLTEKYGDKILQEGGLKVITTLDYELQKKAEEITTRYAKINEIKFNADNASMVGIDPKTGQVLLMIGSRDYFDRENEGNFNVALSHRQPGSAFKPFVYATAFKKGYTPQTTVFDVKTQFQTTCDAKGKPLSSETDPKDCYTPNNYDNIYRGPVTFREALAQSINVPAVKAIYLAGVGDSIKTAKDMGINSLDNQNTYGLTLALGGGEVSLLDITSAYGVFANNGIRNEYSNILEIEDKSGSIIERFSLKSKKVIDRNSALQITDILNDNKARTPAFGARSPLYFEGHDVAVKTGTTNDYRDAWTIGYTPTFSLGVWVGNNDNTSMKKKVAGFIVTPMWNEVMKIILKTYPNENFDKFDIELDTKIKPVLRGIWNGGLHYFTDKISGKLATKYTPKELIKENILTQIHSILYWVDKKNPRGQIPNNPEKDFQFLLWEEPILKWAEDQNIINETIDDIPKEKDDIHTPELYPKISIVSPIKNSIFLKGDKVIIKIEKESIKTISKVDFFVNNVFIGSSNTSPFNFSFFSSDLNNIKKINKLKIIAYDDVLNKTEKNITFIVN